MNGHHKFVVVLAVIWLIWEMMRLNLTEATILGVVGLLVAFGRDIGR